MSDETTESPVIKDLRAMVKKLTEANEGLEGQVAGFARQSVFLEAQIPDTPMAKFFTENYKGDLNAEAVRAAAAELGLTAVEAAAAIPNASAEPEADFAAHAAIDTFRSAPAPALNSSLESQMAALKEGDSDGLAKIMEQAGLTA